MSPKIYKRSNHLRMISHFFTFFFVDSGFRFHCLDPFFLKFSYFHSKKACIQNFFEHELFQCFKNVLLVSLRISFIDYFTLYLSSEKTKWHNQKLKILRLLTNRSNSNSERNKKKQGKNQQQKIRKTNEKNSLFIGET